MVINHNISAMITQSALYKANLAESQSMEKLSTGLRINSAADDAAGLGISENLRSQVNGQSQAVRNTQDGIAMLNIADGALNEQSAILQRMRELVIQAKNDTYTNTERGYMSTEFSQLMGQLDQINSSTNYNGLKIFADPNGAGLVSQGLYDLNYADGISSANYNTAHSVSDVRDLYNDPNDSIFGATDVTSANYYNFNVGGNYSQSDAAGAVHSGYVNGSAPNMITVVFGQMDANSLLTPSPGGISAPGAVMPDGTPLALGSAQALWNSLNFNGDPTGFTFTNPAYDNEDTYLDFLGPQNSGLGVVDMTTQDKLGMLLNIIDGKTSDINTDTINMGYNGVYDTTGLARISQMRAQIGAWTNVLQHSLNNTMNSVTNQQAAESSIRDTDFAQETTTFTKTQILTQSATAMLAQANTLPQSVLSLIR